LLPLAKYIVIVGAFLREVGGNDRSVALDLAAGPDSITGVGLGEGELGGAAEAPPAAVTPTRFEEGELAHTDEKHPRDRKIPEGERGAGAIAGKPGGEMRAGESRGNEEKEEGEPEGPGGLGWWLAAATLGTAAQGGAAGKAHDFGGQVGGLATRAFDVFEHKYAWR